MYTKQKVLVGTCVSIGLLVATAVVKAEDCATQECGQLLSQLQLLQNQIAATNSQLNQLKTDMSFVKHDLDSMHTGTAGKSGLTAANLQLHRTGRGNRNRSAYPH